MGIGRDEFIEEVPGRKAYLPLRDTGSKQGATAAVGFEIKDNNTIDMAYSWRGDMENPGHGGHLRPTYRWPSDIDTITEITPVSAPTGSGQNPTALAFSPNGEWLAQGNSFGSGGIFLRIWRVSGAGTIKQTDPSTQPTGAVLDLDWSPDSQFLAVAHTTTPFITVYQRIDSTFTKLTDPSTLPTGNGQGCAWSPNGQNLVFCHTVASSISIRGYSLTGAPGTPVIGGGGALPSQPGSPSTIRTAHQPTWHPSGRWVACSRNHTSDALDWWRVTVTTYTKVAAKNSFGNAVAWSPDGRLMASSANNAGASRHIRIHIWDEDAETFTLDTDYGTVNDALHLSWHPSGRYLFTCRNNTTNQIRLYERSLDGLTFTQRSEWSSPQPAMTSASDLHVSPGDGHYVALSPNYNAGGLPMILYLPTNEDNPDNAIAFMRYTPQRIGA